MDCRSDTKVFVSSFKILLTLSDDTENTAEKSVEVQPKKKKLDSSEVVPDLDSFYKMLEAEGKILPGNVSNNNCILFISNLIFKVMS